MLKELTLLPSCIGASDNADGTYRLDFADGTSRLATQPEIDAATLSAQRAAIQPATPRQIRQALTAAGLRTAVEGAVAASDQDTKDWWEFATTFERSHPMVVSMGTALGVSDSQLDGLFALASSL